MQKNLKFGGMSKFWSTLCFGLMFLLLITAVTTTNPLTKTVKEASPAAGSSIYRQLSGISLSIEKNGQNIPKMNNSLSKNANTANSAYNHQHPEENQQSFQNGTEQQPEQAKEIAQAHMGSKTLTTERIYINVLNAETGEVKVMELEEYVLYALIGEMPLSFDIEALKAQAVACRTFAIRSAKTGEKHIDADICTDYRCCQCMRSPDTINFDTGKAREAVEATRGIIAVYGGKPILAAYHSSSVGYTKSCEDVWGGKLDYLVPVMAAEDKECTSKETVFSEKYIRNVFSAPDIIFKHNSDGLCIYAEYGDEKVTAKEIKRLLSLRSDSFKVEQVDEKYKFTCYGYGHGVGMSQYGADALAREGYNFYEILKYYYTGISFDFARA